MKMMVKIIFHYVFTFYINQSKELHKVNSVCCLKSTGMTLSLKSSLWDWWKKETQPDMFADWHNAFTIEAAITKHIFITR